MAVCYSIPRTGREGSRGVVTAVICVKRVSGEWIQAGMYPGCIRVTGGFVEKIGEIDFQTTTVHIHIAQVLQWRLSGLASF